MVATNIIGDDRRRVVSVAAAAVATATIAAASTTAAEEEERRRVTAAATAAAPAARVALAAASAANTVAEAARKAAAQAQKRAEPWRFFVYDRVTLHAPLRTSNLGGVSRNRIIAAGTCLQVNEFSEVMFGARGYLRVSDPDAPSEGDWVSARALRRVARKTFPAGARVRFLASGNCSCWRLGRIVSGAHGCLTVHGDDGQQVLLGVHRVAGAVALLGVPLEYTSEGGSRVYIPPTITPWRELGLAIGAAKEAVRAAYRDKACSEPSRQRRAELSLCYNAIGQLHADGQLPRSGGRGMAGNDRAIWSVPDRDNGTHHLQYNLHAGGVVTFNGRHPMVLAAAGAVGRTQSGALPVRDMLRRDARSRQYISAADGRGETLLYKAARSGFYDLVRTLLDGAGMCVDLTQRTGSTALHAACFFGHKDVAQLLVARGADPARRNSYGNTPLEEAHPRLRQRGALAAALGLRGAGGAPPPTVFRGALERGVARGDVYEVLHGGAVVARQLRRAGACAGAGTGVGTTAAPREYERAWHGTKAKFVASILEHGLRASGTALPDGTKLRPPDNHYQLGSAHQGVKNWAAAVFVSPSVSYASHACYAERVVEGGKIWAVVIDCAVRPGSFTRHNQTTSGYTSLPGEPEQPEYRVSVEDECDSQILRVDRHNDVVVTGCTLVDVEFLEGCGLNYQQLRDLLA